MKMMTIGIMTLAAWSLSGCAGAIIYGESRKVTREAVRPIVAEAMPGVDADAASLCVIKGMTAGEVLSLPNSNTIKATDTFAPVVRGVMARPDVATCLATVPARAS